MRRLAIAAIVALLLTGCVGIPDSGTVQEGDVAEESNAGGLVFIAELPDPGATQEQIILGFLQAGISQEDDYAIAREYLSDELAGTWDPTAGVTVRSGQPQVTSTSAKASEASFSVSSRIDATGVLTPSTDDTDRLPFELVQENGEWRISQSPDGIVLSAYHFDQLFKQHSVYFYGQDGASLVPDVRWFERSAETIVARIVDAALAGPAPWLAPAVTTHAALGVTQPTPPIIDAGAATVTVSGSQLALGGTDELAMLAVQLETSLESVGVTSMSVHVSGTSTVASSSDAPAPERGVIDPRALVLDGDQLTFVGSGSSTITSVGPELVALGATTFSVMPGGEAGVASSPAGVWWMANGVPPASIGDASSVPPTLSADGWVWTVADADQSRIAAWRDGDRVSMTLPAPAGERVVAVEVSRDGSRMAILTRGDGVSHLAVASIVRAAGVPTLIGEPLQLPEITGDASDLTWTGESSVAVLATADDASLITEVDVGGDATQLPTPTQAVTHIVGGTSGSSSVRGLTSDGHVISLVPSGWRVVTSVTNVSLIATQL